MAPLWSIASHWSLRSDARAGSAFCSTERYTSIGPEPRQTLRPVGTSADCRIAMVGAVCGVGLGAGLKTACVWF